MSYLLIKRDDSKIFKDFISGNEIEVGVFMNPRTNIFGKGDEIEVFYGSEESAIYKAQVTERQKKFNYTNSDDQALMMIKLVKR